MKNTILAIAILATVGCTRISVDPGHEAVVIKKPWLFGHGGVDPSPVKPGLELAALSTDSVDVVMQPVTYDENFDDIMPKDNNPVDYHAAVRLQITDSVDLVTNFGPEFYKNNIQRQFQTMNRNQVRQYSMPELALQQEVVQRVEAELEKELAAFLATNKIPVAVRGVTLGKISPQKEIISAYNETGVQQQRAKTEQQRALAEEQRKVAETKRAIADRAYQENLGLSAEQYIRLQQIKVCGEKQNCSMFIGASPLPTVQVH